VDRFGAQASVTRLFRYLIGAVAGAIPHSRAAMRAARLGWSQGLDPRGRALRDPIR
jgi:hypothetical protein